jgi:hypothetical protein
VDVTKCMNTAHIMVEALVIHLDWFVYHYNIIKNT